MAVIARKPDTTAARISAEDCERQAMPAAAHTLRECADYIDALPDNPRGAVEVERAARAVLDAFAKPDQPVAEPLDRLAALLDHPGGQSDV